MSQPLYDEIWDYDQPALTEQRFKEKLAQIPQDKGEAHLQLLTQIARAQGLQREFDSAHQTLDEVAQALTDATPTAQIRYLLERGRALNSSGKPEEARPLFEQAWAAAQEYGEDFYAVDAAHMIAIVAPPAEQLEWNLRAMKIAEGSDSPSARRWLGSLYNNTGWTYHDQGDYAEALRIFQQAESWFAQLDPPSPSRLRIARWTVARALRSLKQNEAALKILRELEASDDGTSAGYLPEEIAENLLEQGDAAAAAPYFAKAYDQLSGDIWLQANEPERLERLRALSSQR